jgi:hypothetical protein
MYYVILNTVAVTVTVCEKDSHAGFTQFTPRDFSRDIQPYREAPALSISLFGEQFFPNVCRV